MEIDSDIGGEGLDLEAPTPNQSIDFSASPAHLHTRTYTVSALILRVILN